MPVTQWWGLLEKCLGHSDFEFENFTQYGVSGKLPSHYVDYPRSSLLLIINPDEPSVALHKTSEHYAKLDAII